MGSIKTVQLDQDGNIIGVSDWRDDGQPGFFTSVVAVSPDGTTREVASGRLGMGDNRSVAEEQLSRWKLEQQAVAAQKKKAEETATKERQAGSNLDLINSQLARINQMRGITEGKNQLMQAQMFGGEADGQKIGYEQSALGRAASGIQRGLKARGLGASTLGEAGTARARSDLLGKINEARIAGQENILQQQNALEQQAATLGAQTNKRFRFNPATGQYEYV